MQALRHLMYRAKQLKFAACTSLLSLERIIERRGDKHDHIHNTFDQNNIYINT